VAVFASVIATLMLASLSVSFLPACASPGSNP